MTNKFYVKGAIKMKKKKSDRLCLIICILMLAILACSIGRFNLGNDDDIEESEEPEVEEETTLPPIEPSETETAEPTFTNTVTPSNTPEPTMTQTATLTPTETPSGPFEYEVQEGDTLWSIALDFGISMEGLMAINNISADYVLNVGDVLLIVPPTPTSEP